MYINIPELQKYLAKKYGLKELNKDYSMTVDVNRNVIIIKPFDRVEEFTITMEVSD